MQKYILFIFVFLLYNTFYSQEKKDTLFFHYDEDYLEEYKGSPDQYYPEDTNDDEGAFIFIRNHIYYNLKPSKISCLKAFIHSTKFYDKTKVRPVRYFDLPKVFEDFVVFFVKKEGDLVKYIQVIPATEIY